MNEPQRTDPPGSRSLTYPRPSDAFAPRPTERRAALSASEDPFTGFTAARFAVDGKVLPMVSDTLPLAEVFRSALLAVHERVQRRRFGWPAERRPHSATLSGKGEDRVPLGGHGHAYYLPTDEDRDGRIDHITVFARGVDHRESLNEPGPQRSASELAEPGFRRSEVNAFHVLRDFPVDEDFTPHIVVRQLRALWRQESEQAPKFRLLLVGLGRPSDFTCPLFASTAVWEAATPFIVTRYPKLRGTKRDRPEDYASPRAFARHVLGQELERMRALAHWNDLPEVVSIEDEEVIGAHRLRPIQFKRFRRKAGDDGGRRPAGAFRITFAAPVRGPLCLGHSCHFGLGLFLPSSPAPTREARC